MRPLLTQPSGRRIVAACMPRMAPSQASNGQAGCPKHAVGLERQSVVFRAARLESARRGQEGTYQQLVSTHRGHEHTCCGHHGRGSFAAFSRCALRVSVPSVLRISSSRSPNRRSTTPGRATNITATSACRAPCSRRYASRKRRRPRFRITAPPTRRLTANPTRRPCANGRHSTTKLGLSSRLPCRKSAWISEARRSRSLRCRESLPEGIRLPPLYTVSRLRPFARRRLSTFRPPCVFIRWRNPCVLLRRRLFG